MAELKTFSDLKFGAHRYDGIHAVMFFDNGYGVSVVKTSFCYGTAEAPYEVAILTGNKEKYCICYDTPITDDVIGYLDEDGVTEIMKDVQEL